jgi:hypothetical protein
MKLDTLSCVAVLAILAGPSLAFDRGAELAAKLEPTGEKTDCLMLRNLNIIPVTDSEFLVRVGLNDYYRTRTNGSCNGATRSFNRLQHKTTIGRLCNLDIVEVIDNSTGQFMGACSLGEFEKMREKAPAEPAQ